MNEDKNMQATRRTAAHRGDSVQARLVLLRELQSATGEELRRRRTLMPSIMDKAFKGEL